MFNLKDSNSFDIQAAINRISSPPEEFRRIIKAQAEQDDRDRKNSYRQTEILEGLLEDSRNAIEQRNALIRFMVEGIINSEQPQEGKKKLLMDLLVPVATVSSGAGDLMQLVKDGLEAIG